LFLFYAGCALLFAASTVLTVSWCASMSAMAGMRMPGGWTMSMAWMRMPGQTWPGAAAAFLGMWTVMMVAMMLPSLLPMLTRYRAALSPACRGRLGALTLVVGAGYFFVWAMIGLGAWALGVALALLAMQLPELARAVPVAVSLVVLIAGMLQLTPWKARSLACCRQDPGCGATLAGDAGTAWKHGMHLGVVCARCCSGLMAILLVVGVMDLSVMAIVTLGITLERLAPSGVRAARVLGVAIVGCGLCLAVRAAGLN
jgi:predicted metal-binding membrane protein